jgi:type IV pilus assembly protein PilN
MPHFNLLPWREKKRQRIVRHFFITATLLIIINFTAALLARFYLHHDIKHEKIRIAYLETQVQSYEVIRSQITVIEVQKNILTQRIHFIEALQKKQMRDIALFQSFITLLPQSVYFTQISRQGNSLSLSGQAETHESVSTLFHNIESLPFFTQPKLHLIHALSDNEAYPQSFELKVKSP